MASFANRLKLLREECKLSQEELGKIFHLSQSIIAHYEAGRKQPSQETLKKLADYFHTSVDYLLGRSEYRSNKRPVTKQDLAQAIASATHKDDGTPLTEEEKKRLLDHMDLILRDINAIIKR